MQKGEKGREEEGREEEGGWRWWKDAGGEDGQAARWSRRESSRAEGRGDEQEREEDGVEGRVGDSDFCQEALVVVQLSSSPRDSRATTEGERS